MILFFLIQIHFRTESWWKLLKISKSKDMASGYERQLKCNWMLWTGIIKETHCNVSGFTGHPVEGENYYWGLETWLSSKNSCCPCRGSESTSHVRWLTTAWIPAADRTPSCGLCAYCTHTAYIYIHRHIQAHNAKERTTVKCCFMSPCSAMSTKKALKNEQTKRSQNFLYKGIIINIRHGGAHQHLGSENREIKSSRQPGLHYTLS